MKKKIFIDFVGFWDGFKKEDNFVYRSLIKKYDVVISDNPDYIFCNMFGTPYEYMKYSGIRIFLSGENMSPDFNYVDYAIGFDPLSYGDRYLRYPEYLWATGVERLQDRHIFTMEDLKEKTCFCNFIFSHERDDEMRKVLFEELSKYKQVDSLGTYLNNDSSGQVIRWKEKRERLKTYKFSIALESNDLAGFVTEKITDAFAGRTVPIYMGAPDAAKEINPKAFLNLADYENVDTLIDEIKRLDNDDEAYIAMLNEPVFVEENYVTSMEHKLDVFLSSIFEQDKEKAYRRCMGPQGGLVVSIGNQLYSAFNNSYKRRTTPSLLIRGKEKIFNWLKK